MDIREAVSLEIPCSACGSRYEVTLKQILLSEEMLHEGCPVQVVGEHPPLTYSGLVDQEVIQELQTVWTPLEEKAHGTGGEVKLRFEIESRLQRRPNETL